MIWQDINKAEEQLFSYRIDEASSTFLAIVDQLQELLSQRPEAEGQMLPVLEELLEAMQNKDYLLVADLLEYRLKSLLGSWLQ